jgi:penicillin-binding protein 2
MLIFDQLKKDDRQLRLVALVVFGGMFVLLVGLWWVQVARARDYQAHLETQSFRTVRTPAVRGRILDRNGQVLAENRPNYSVSLYFEDLRKAFDDAYTEAVGRARAQRENLIAQQQKKLGRALTKQERRAYGLSLAEKNSLRAQARYAVASNFVSQLSSRLQQPAPLTLDPAKFQRDYATRLALPYPVLNNLAPVHIARFQEQFAGTVGAELEIESTRVYPLGPTAAHGLGYLRRDDSSAEGEEAYFSYWLRDYRGVVGIEGYFDKELRGRAGGKSVLVNNLGYRQAENMWVAAEPGQTVVLTLDARIQQEAERALRTHAGAQVRGAVVVMDVRNGDVLALVSAPAVDPNNFIRGFPTNEIARWQDEKLGVQKNRATRETYQPGSTFKPIVALAALETRAVTPEEVIRVEPNPRNPQRGIIRVGNQSFRDTAPPGDYDLRRALVRSSNSYFIGIGQRSRVMEKVVDLSHRLHLGERIGLPLLQESAGHFPALDRVRNWSAGNTANICIGQGEMDVTPLQMAVVACALANGGTVLKPRLVERLESQDPASVTASTVFPRRQVVGALGVSERSLKTVRDAMLAETEDPVEGTGRHAHVEGLRICGKTGTAEREEHGIKKNTTWFISFAPYENPRHAVVVMVENGVSGGTTCAPVAADVYSKIKQLEAVAPGQSMAQKQ